MKKFNYKLNIMKNLLTITALFLSLLLNSGCDKPAPTELFDDSSEDEYEVLNKNLDDQYYNSGVDTSGLEQDLRGLTNIISLSGIKITNNNETFNLSLAQAIFFDRSKPIYYSNGDLLAYQTVTPGIIKFDNHLARTVDFHLHYRDQGALIDTVLGKKYVLYSGIGGWLDPFRFRYNSSIQFEFNPIILPVVTFDIRTPHEINGNVIMQGSHANRDLQAILSWNALHGKRITLILGVKIEIHGRLITIPVYRIRTSDDGNLVVPKQFLNELPLERFSKLVFTFIRSVENFKGDGNNKLLVSAQSIHSIAIDIN
jgi:hypothetical protein